MGERLVGLLGTRGPVDAALKLGGHGALALLAARDRQRWWGARAVISLSADVLMVRRMHDGRYRPGPLRTAWEAVDAAMWANLTGEGPATPGLLLMVDSASSATWAGATLGAGVEALPVYDAQAPFPPDDLTSGLRAAAAVLVPIVVPFVATWASRRAGGRRTSPSLLVWGSSSALCGFAFFRNRDRLQRRSRRVWAQRAAAMVDRERVGAQFRTLAASSPGHDFKKTLFALGLEGSPAALDAARSQGARPGESLDSLPGMLLGEASHRVRIEPPGQAFRLLDPEQVAALQGFLVTASENAVDGMDQVLEVRELDSFTTEIRYLGARHLLRDDPPPLVADLNPTAGSFLWGTLLKALGLLPATRELHPAVVAPLLAVDLVGLVRFWHRPVDRTSQAFALRLAVGGCLVAVAAAATPLAPLRNAEGTDVYPSLAALRDLLLVVLPNWDDLSPRDRAVIPLGLGAALLAIAVRRRHTGVDWLTVAAGLSTPATALAMFRSSSLVEEEAALLERQLFDRFAATLAEARRHGEADELAAYAAQLEVARAALRDLPDLDPGFRREVEADCAHLAGWLQTRV